MQTQTFAAVYIIMLVIVVFLLIENIEVIIFKDDNGNINFPTQFCLGTISNGFNNTESYGFSVDYKAIDKSDILNIYKYSMANNNIK